MSGSSDALDQLIVRLRAFRDARNWSQYHTPKDLALSVSVEAGELLELFQWRKEAEPVDEALAAALADEAADVLLYLLLLSDKAGVDLISAAHRKIDRNEARFPAERAFGVAKPNDESAAS